MFEYAGAAGRTQVQRAWDAVRDHPSGVLLVVQLLSVLLFPYTDSRGPGRTALSAISLVVLVIAVLAVNRTPTTRVVAWSLGVPVFALTIAEAIWPDVQPLILVSYTAHAIFYFHTAVSLLRYMFADAWVSRDELFATGACFTVLAWAYAYTYGAIQIAWPGSFLTDAGSTDLSWMDLLFLSFTTLTGTGLSDISPVTGHNEARSVMMLQMLTGMNYIALVVARLLGLTLVKFRR